MKNIGSTLAWGVGGLLAITGLIGGIGNGEFVAGAGMILMGLAVLPVVKIYNRNITLWQRLAALFVGIMIVGSSPTTEATTKPPAQEKPVIQEREEQVTATKFDVIRVIDGDTIVVQTANGIEESARLIGIDATERGECYSKEATARLQEIIGSNTVELQVKPTEDRDAYNRLLRYVEVNGQDAGGILVQEGFAKHYTRYAHPREGDYKRKELAAKKSELGLWSGVCDAPKAMQSSSAAPVPVPQVAPATTTREEPTPQAQDCNVKGNISYKTGEKIYHLPGCPNYNATKISTSKGERYFCTEADARVAGWRKAYNCP